MTFDIVSVPNCDFTLRDEVIFDFDTRRVYGFPGLKGFILTRESMPIALQIMLDMLRSDQCCFLWQIRRVSNRCRGNRQPGNHDYRKTGNACGFSS